METPTTGHNIICTTFAREYFYIHCKSVETGAQLKLTEILSADCRLPNLQIHLSYTHYIFEEKESTTTVDPEHGELPDILSERISME